MFSSIALGPDGEANHKLAVMRGKSRTGDLKDIVKFLPGFSLHADPALRLSGQYTSPRGRILELDARMGGAGDWVGLHLSLPARSLKEVGVLGFAARTSASDTTVLRVCLRSGDGDSFTDCFFDKHLLLRPEEASHLDALPVGYRDDLPVEAAWRELILFLPTEDFRLALIDLRVFMV
ncbi:hypothetical protein [Shimia biformata]|uniref:hypothetical protein n=1 Tax=Shimia biformata TaxID=1294299 RepID=UPI001951FD14|nr:hypothetical protein [Shimia biformata]